MRIILFIISVMFVSNCTSPSFTMPTEKLNKTDVRSEGPKVGTRNNPGKCYQKMKWPDENTYWTEIICDKDLNKRLIQEIALNLKNINYPIDKEAINGKITSDLKKAISSYQSEQGLAVGGITEVLVYQLRKSAE